MTGSDEQWSRISAEAELRPERGVVADVPTPQVTPLPEDDEPDEPIEPTEIPPSDDVVAEPQRPSVQPIQVVPFHPGPETEPGPDVIVAAPFSLPAPDATTPDEPAPAMITDVPIAEAEPLDVPADLPEGEAQRQKTPWWRLMLGGGRRRVERSTGALDADYPNLPET